MARSSVVDILDKFRWTVSIDGFTKLGFTTFSTPEYELQIRSYPEGGAHLTPRKIVDGITYKPVILTRGVTNDTSFNKWATGFIDKVQNHAGVKNNSLISAGISGGIGEVATQAVKNAKNNGAKAIPTYTGGFTTNFVDDFSYRRDVKIEHVNSAGQVEVIYMLYNAFPSAYKPASDFDASADDSMSIESLTLEYESFEVLFSGLSGALANIGAKNILG